MKIQTVALFYALFALLLSTTHAADIYVAQDGSDTNPGTSGQPLASLAAAQRMVRRAAVSEAVTVHVADGIYYLPETLIFTPEDSGTETKPVVYRAVNEGRAVLSGGSRLNLDWEPYQHGIFQAKTPAGLKIDQLFINGKNQWMARYPNYDASKKTDAYQGYATDAVRDPLFEYRETNDLTKIDRTPGPKTNNYPSLGTVEDCLIHGIGRVERQPAGVMLDMASEITVRDCSVYDCARAGINIGDGACSRCQRSAT